MPSFKRKNNKYDLSPHGKCRCGKKDKCECRRKDHNHSHNNIRNSYPFNTMLPRIPIGYNGYDLDSPYKYDYRRKDHNHSHNNIRNSYPFNTMLPRIPIGYTGYDLDSPYKHNKIVKIVKIVNKFYCNCKKDKKCRCHKNH